jgi:predicted DNA-binding transcriptional regulator AlpA
MCPVTSQHRVPTSRSSPPGAAFFTIQEKKALNHSNRLPVPGYSRVREILDVFPVSRSRWYAAVAEGRIAPPTKLGVRTAAWSNAYLNELLTRLEAGERIL